MTVTSVSEFRSAVLKHLSFSAFPQQNCTLYKNPERPELGYFLHYSRPGYYDLGIADYTITENFSLTFANPTRLMRFGTVYAGATRFRLADGPIDSFTPSSFFVVEKDIRGKQAWKKGDHYHGVEITIYENYFKEIIAGEHHQTISLDTFQENHTYRYLPLDIVSIIQRLQSLSALDGLNSLFLEAKILECIAIIFGEIQASPDNAFTTQLNRGTVSIGKNRKLTLTSYDISALHKAHSYLTEHAFQPPTIEALSEIVLLNPQKLKAGFSFYYHMAIGEYVNSIRMTAAANLLFTTERSVHDIAQAVGYDYCSNFIKMFKKTYNMTPLSYRKKETSLEYNLDKT